MGDTAVEKSKKAGLDTVDFKNFRPITNLSTISKIIERLALNRMRRCITESPNYGKLQSAYRQGHSTKTALVKIMDDIIKTVDCSVVALASLDISAAFDAVDHDVLVRRLEDEFGITGTCSRWIQSYLTGRTTVVHVGQSSSAAAAVQFRVPQGSVLGPILYTAYVAPIGRLV
jgi:Reverse transcriptase (RNA-dependent DNA polymerase)